MTFDAVLTQVLELLQREGRVSYRALKLRFDIKPTVCPSNDFAHMLSDQEFPTSIQVWRGHGQEAKKGSAGGHRLTRHVKRLGHFPSRVRPPGCPCVQWGA